MPQLKRFQTALAASELDAAIISSQINTDYLLTDYSYTDGYLLVSEDRAYALADFRYIESAREQIEGFEVVMPTDGMYAGLAELIAKNGWRRIGIEESALSCRDFERLAESLPRCTLIHGVSAMLSAQRAVKLPYELERIEAAQKITDAAFEHILGYISPNITEQELALELEFFMRRMSGSSATAFDTIAVSGSASSLPHGVPLDITLRRGFLTMDFGAKFKGYCSDMTRTVVIGKADAEMKRVYNTVLSAQRAALENICAGMLCRDADAIARDIIREAGYGPCFGHSLGHGVGCYIHEAPSLAPRAAEDSVLCSGNVVTIEPGIYIEGKYGCRIEDMIAINPDGSLHNFTHSPKELIEI